MHKPWKYFNAAGLALVCAVSATVGKAAEINSIAGESGSAYLSRVFQAQGFRIELSRNPEFVVSIPRDLSEAILEEIAQSASHAIAQVGKFDIDHEGAIQISGISNWPVDRLIEALEEAYPLKFKVSGQDMHISVRIKLAARWLELPSGWNKDSLGKFWEIYPGYAHPRRSVLVVRETSRGIVIFDYENNLNSLESSLKAVFQQAARSEAGRMPALPVPKHQFNPHTTKP